MTKIRFHLICLFSCLFALAMLTRDVFASEYMHESKDTDATALNLSELAGKGQAELILSEGLPENAKGGGLLALSNESVQLKNPVLPHNVVMENLGKTIRFHIWIKAEDVKAENNLWFASPTVTFQLFDDYGTQLVNVSSLFKTRGTYPWHCYYIDVKMPRRLQLTGKAANALSDELQELLSDNDDFFGDNVGAITKPGFYVTFSNYSSGTAWFGGLSYEILTDANAKNRSKWLNAQSGSNAPNPEYDELPIILYYGIPSDHPWNFLSGNQAFQSILTNAGLREYLATNRDDWFHLQKGIAMLPYIYTTANALKLCPGFEDGWLDTLRNELIAMQDSNTGFWTVRGIPNLLATEAIASNCFSPMSQRRADVSSTPTPWHSVAEDATLPHAREIIDTLLANRVEGTAGWNEFLLQPSEFGAFSRDNSVSLGATAAAVKLLVLAANTLPPADAQRAKAQVAVRQAYSYAMEKFVLGSGTQPGLWSESTTAASDVSRSGAFMLDLLNAVPVLEHRVNPSLPPPHVELMSENDKGIRVIWRGKDAPRDLVAVRIYSSRANVKTFSLTEKNICCFIERPDAPIYNEDPLVAAFRIVEAARTEWGLTPEAAGCDYLAAKMALLPKRLPIGRAEKAVNVEAPAMVLYTVADDNSDEDTSIVYYAVGVNSYGETTDYIPIKAND